MYILFPYFKQPHGAILVVKKSVIKSNSKCDMIIQDLHYFLVQSKLDISNTDLSNTMDIYSEKATTTKPF